jgi:tRNA U38,U39,U40 pseudouridine synthase TruA
VSDRTSTTPRTAGFRLTATSAAAVDAADGDGGLRRYRARVLYDGSDFRGSQIQPEARSVSGALEAALARVQLPARVVAAGRTDTGVHARGQAVHFDVRPRRGGYPAERDLQHSLNCVLPPDVRVMRLEQAPERDALHRRWHSQLWSTGKLYSYRLSTGAPRPTPRRAAPRRAAPRRVRAADRARRTATQGRCTTPSSAAIAITSATRSTCVRCARRRG